LSSIRIALQLTVAMSFEVDKEQKLPETATSAVDADSDAGTTHQVIYIDPEKEKAAFRRFDLFVFPVSVIFMVLSSLDRNNVSDNLQALTPSQGP
jgi:hypothetical protein